MTTNPLRQPGGTPIGGQFATGSRIEPEADGLSVDGTGWNETELLAYIKENGLIPPKTFRDGTVDSRDLGDECDEAVDILDDPETYSLEERAEAYVTLLDLNKAARQALNYGDWTEGDNDLRDTSDLWKRVCDEGSPTLVRDDYWQDYAEEEAEQLGLIAKDASDIIINNIDWEGVADDLKADYIEFELSGYTYWCRTV